LKVKISYTTDMDNIPTESARMVGKLKEQLDVCVSRLESLESLPSVKTVKCLDELRKDLGYADVMATDLISILDGYLRATIASLDEHSSEETRDV